MASRSIKAALADVLENLSEENFKKFCHHLMDLRAGLRVRRTAVEGKSCLEVADVMVSTFTEAKVVAVAEEILRAIGCNLEADDLAEETPGPSNKPVMVSLKRHNPTVNINKMTVLDDEDEDFYKNLQIHEKYLIDALKDKKQRPGVDMMHRGMTSFSEISSEVKQKHFVDKQGPSWSQRVDQMVFVIELLLETIGDLSDKELEKFQQLSHYHHPSFIYTWSPTPTEEIDLHDTVFLMVKTYGQESVRKTKRILGRMKRIDLTQRLSDITSGPRKKLSVDEHLSALFHKVATMASVRELLLETLSDLRQQELKKFKWFLQFTCFHKGLTQIPWRQLDWEEREEAVDLMVKMFGQLSVEVTMEVFMHMNRTDLAQRLSETSSELKGTESSAETFIGTAKEKETEEHHSVLTQKVETMVSVIELLLETLAGLRHGERKKFTMFLRQIHHQKPNSDILRRLQEMWDVQDTVFLLAQTYDQQSVEKTKEILEKMKRRDLLEKLSLSSSGPTKKLSKTEQSSALIQIVAKMAAVKQLLLETLNNLSYSELMKFQEWTASQWLPPDITWMLTHTDDREEIVNVIIQMFGQQSMEVTRKVLMDMDLVERLSKTSLWLKEHSVDEHGPAPYDRLATMASVKELLLETLSDLGQQEFKKFKCFLQFTCFHKGLTQIPWRQLEQAEMKKAVDLMVEMFGQLSVEVTMEVFMHMNRTDLAQRLSETSSELKGTESSAETFIGAAKEKETEEHHSVLTQKVETMVSVIELLLETLAGLRDGELKEFMMFLRQIHHQKPNSDILWRLLTMSDVQDTVFLLVQTYDQQSVEKTKEILEKMKRSDLLEKLSLSSSGPTKKLSKTEQSSALIQIVAKMAAVKQLLLETLNNLSYSELMKFKRWTASQWLPPDITWMLTHTDDREEIVDVIMQMFGQQSMEVTRKVLMDMDLVERLSKTSLWLKEHSVDEHGPAPYDRVSLNLHSTTLQ
ncbi:uncharacterized protein LOC113136756 [Mastacembelus armatus]|uniref:uncharacterized protein LOC113136756 n=1 Tax=Mastacembelus armatus TaxID=205130 RepID=UPI000E455B5F|nr:uncharacterized protein LOC113136756 [Mastacembelus armatus]